MSIFDTIKNVWIKTKQKTGYKYMKIYGIYLFGILFAFGLFIYLFMFWLSDPSMITNTYNSTNTYQPEQDESSTYDMTNYIYYLDISPSMAGFIRSDNNKFHAVSDILRNINMASPSQGNKFYLCGNEIMNESQDTFFDFMKQYDYMNDYYDSRINNGDLNVISDIDLANIFTSQYDDDSNFQESLDEVNILITDLNFLLNDKSRDNQFEIFAGELASRLRGYNICIYNIYSHFDGILTDDFSLIGTTNDNYSGHDFSFYIIIFSKNESLFKGYKSNIERLFTVNTIDFSNNFEIMNDILNGNHNLDCGNTVVEDKVRLNYDTKSFDRLSSNAMGFRHFTLNENNELNSLKLFIMPLETSGNYAVAESTDMSINTEVQIYYRTNNRYVEYTHNDIIKSIYAGTAVYDDKPYLYTEIILDAGINIEGSKDGYFIIDINYIINQPQFSVPEWVLENSSINTAGINTAILFEWIINAKKVNFAQINEYHKQIGNMLIYVIN